MLNFLKYVFRDQNEVFWMYKFERVGDIEGWYTYAMKPGELRFFCKGLTTEIDVRQRLSDQPTKIQEDDRIELGKWLMDFGVEQWTEDFRIIKEEI